MCRLSSLLPCFLYMHALTSFLLLTNPLRKAFLCVSCFIKTPTPALQFIFIGIAPHLPRASGSSLVSLMLCVSPEFSPHCKQVCSISQSFFCIWLQSGNWSKPQQGVENEQVSYLGVDFKSVYFLCYLSLLLYCCHTLFYYWNVSGSKCCHWANVHWLRIWMKSKPNWCKIIRLIYRESGEPSNSMLGK